MVVLYSKPNCPPCHTIKLWLDRNKVDYKEFDLDVSEFPAAPVVIINDLVLQVPAPYVVVRSLREANILQTA